MACTNPLVSIMKSCAGSNSGGIFNVYINDHTFITSITASASTHMITGLTASSNFATYEFNRNVGNVLTSPKIDFLNGSTYFENTLNIVLARREASKSASLQILGEGQRFLDIIVLDANGTYWYYENMQLSGGDEDSGTARADGSKYAVTFIGESDHRPYEIPKALVTSVLV